MATSSKKTTKNSTSKKSTSKKTSQSINTSAKKYIKKETKKFMKQHKGFSTFLTIFLIIFVGIGGVLYYLGYLDPIIDKYLGNDDNGVQEPIVFDGTVYEDFQVHFLELGNWYAGDSVYIKAGNNDILIDAGSRKSSAETIKNYVDQFCTDGKLEYVIATHAHQDHIAGFVGTKSGNVRNGIFYSYEVGTLIDFSLTNATSDIYNEYIEARDYLISNGTTHYTAKECWNQENGATRKISLGEDMSFEIIYNKYYFESSPNDENEYSVCTLFSYKDHHMLFTGDLEEKGEKALAEYYDGTTLEKTLPKVELFKAGHHGSPTSSNTCLLKKIQPKVVCVCCCAGSDEYRQNSALDYFPSQSFIDRVAPYTMNVYVTTLSTSNEEKTFSSMNGNILFSSNGASYSVACSNNNTLLKDTDWFKNNRNKPSNW